MVLVAGLLLMNSYSLAQGTAGTAQLPLLVGTGSAGTSFSVPVQTLLFFTALSFLPAILLMMTGFTRIVIVLSLLRQALGTQAVPPNQVVVGLSLFLTMFVMGPTLDTVYNEAYVPYNNNTLPFEQALAKAEVPMRSFMSKQTRQSDLALFVKLGKLDPATNATNAPMRGLVPAFVTSELCDQRTEIRVPDWFHDLHSLFGDRHCRGQCLDVPGHDDAVAGSGGAAVQVDDFCVGGWLELADGFVGRQLCDLRGRHECAIGVVNGTGSTVDAFNGFGAGAGCGFGGWPGRQPVSSRDPDQ